MDSLKFLLVCPRAESHAGLEQHECEKIVKEFLLCSLHLLIFFYLNAAVIFSGLPWFCLVSMTHCPALVSWGFCRSDTGQYLRLTFLPSAHPGVCVIVFSHTSHWCENHCVSFQNNPAYNVTAISSCAVPTTVTLE